MFRVLGFRDLRIGIQGSGIVSPGVYGWLAARGFERLGSGF